MAKMPRNRWSDQSEAEDHRRKSQKEAMVRQLSGEKEPVEPVQRVHPHKAPSTLAQAAETKNHRQPQGPGLHQTRKKKKANKKNHKRSKGWLSGYRRADWARVRGMYSGPDLMLLQISLILLAMGLVMVFSSSSYEALMLYGKGGYYFLRQLTMAVGGLLIVFILLFVNTEVVRRIAPYLLFISVVLILVASFFTEAQYGAHRWITVGPITFMPSDLAKPLLVVVAAGQLERVRDRLDSLPEYGMTLLTMMIIPCLVLIEDLGTGVAMAGALFAMLYIAGAPKQYVVGTMGLGLMVFVAAVIAKPYRMMRLTSFINPMDPDKIEAGSFQLVQSLYAFGDGGLFGVGLGNGGQKMSHLFGSHTDFIYAVIGEELGLIGALCVLALFIAFAWRGFWLAMHISDFYKSLIVFGLTAMITLQALINMGVAVGVLPVTGIALPFISYGGSSLVVTLAMVGYLLNLSRYVQRPNKRKS